MDVGFFMIFTSYGWENCSDKQVWDEDLRLCEIAADSGFDCVWSAEHHFEDYSFCPDNLQLMTHLAAEVATARGYITEQCPAHAPSLPKR